jgi:DNA repair exonuclease SbcCD ATPase subunit
MRIISIKAENFLSYKSIDYSYSNQGLTLIEGFDHDLSVSTGAGKSAFLDVVCYALFGKISKDVLADEVINRQERKNLYVQLDFEDGGKEYRVVRYRRHDRHGNDLYLVDNGCELRGKDIRETQALIEETIGFSFEVFSKATYFSQFSPTDRFLSASDAEKKALISEICDLSYYDDLLDKVKAHAQAIEKEIQATSQEVSILSARHQEKVEQQRRSQDQIAQWQRYHDKKLAKLRSDSESFITTRAEALKSITDRYNAASHQAEVSALERDGIEVQELDFSGERKDIEQKLKLIEQLEVKARSFDADVMVADREAKVILNKMKVEKSKIDIKQDSTCPHCYAPMSFDHIHKHLASLEGELREKVVAIDSAKKNSAAIAQSIQIKQSLKDRLIRMQTEILEMSNRQMKRALLNQKIEQLVKQMKDLKKDEEIQNSHENPYIDQLKEAETEVNPYQALDLSKEIVNMGGQIDTLNDRLKQKNEDLKYAMWWKEALAVYIRSYLMDSFLDQINAQANEYLQTLFDGILQIDIAATTEKGKDTKEKISVTITNGTDECSYESLSGGERCRVCLAVNLAISDLACKMSKKTFNILMMDEIFTGLDEHGKNQTMKLLKELEHRFDTIFVIDHTEAFKSMFTNTITVSKRSGVSQVEKVNV